jgi:Kef-type K+ transport system membrane component KefB
LIFPISKFFVPIFFVHMGMGVNLAAFSSFSVILLGLALSFVAVLGKQACALGIFGKENQSLSKILIGVGMIPRGEVGLIFAGIGAKLMLDGSPVIDDNLYAAIIVMILFTTLVTPPLLKIIIDKKEAKSH